MFDFNSMTVSASSISNDAHVCQPTDHLPTITSADRSLAIHSDLANAIETAKNNLAPATKAAYATALRIYSSYAGAVSVEDALPADPRMVAAWISHLHSSGMKASSIDVKLSALVNAHAAAGYTLDRRILTPLMGSIRREAGSAVRQVPALMIDDLKRIVDGLDVTRLSAIRDRALLLVGFAAALRRSELVSLDVGPDGDGYVEFVSEGLEITLRRSKTDQQGAGQTISLPFGGDHCAVRALRDWLEASGIESGAIFRAVDRHGNIGGRLEPRAVRLIVKRRGEAAGVANADKLSAHSLRAGFATSAAAGGVPEHLIQQQTRHKNLETLRGYIRNANRFSENALNGMGL